MIKLKSLLTEKYLGFGNQGRLTEQQSQIANQMLAMYKNKTNVFDSFCWHYDEVKNLPSGTTVLSSNEMSDIQSMVFTRDKSEIWGVQYHPEFDPGWISGLMQQRKKLLLEEGIYLNSEEFDKFSSFFASIEKNDDKKNQLSISETIINRKTHTVELSNWLKNFMSVFD